MTSWSKKNTAFSTILFYVIVEQKRDYLFTGEIGECKEISDACSIKDHCKIAMDAITIHDILHLAKPLRHQV